MAFEQTGYKTQAAAGLSVTISLQACDDLWGSAQRQKDSCQLSWALKDRLLVAGGMVQVGAACMCSRGTTSVLILIFIFKLELDTRH